MVFKARKAVLFVGSIATVTLRWDKQRGAAHLKACFDDSEWQHADAGDGSSTGTQQHSLTGVGLPVLEVVLLQRVEGAEVDAHARDAAEKWLQEAHRSDQIEWQWRPECVTSKTKHCYCAMGLCSHQPALYKQSVCVVP